MALWVKAEGLELRGQDLGFGYLDCKNETLA